MTGLNLFDGIDVIDGDAEPVDEKFTGALTKVRGVWFPGGEKHLTDMVANHSKVGDRGGRGNYQLHKLDRAMELLPADRRRLAVDIGAHCGLWGMHFVDLFTEVIGFEPVEEFARIWKLNVKRHNWRVLLCALGDTDGAVTMEIDDTFTGGTHVVGQADILRDALVDTPTPKMRTVSAPMRTLDSFELLDVDLVKIDVEGFEHRVLEGAAETLAQSKPLIIVEQKGNDEKNFGFARGQAQAFLRRLGARELDVISGDYFYGW